MDMERKVFWSGQEDVCLTLSICFSSKNQSKRGEKLLQKPNTKLAVLKAGSARPLTKKEGGKVMPISDQ